MGLVRMLERRGREAGLPRLHPHQFRHTFAHQWLAEGGGETDLMRLAGWKSRAMLQRYGASAAERVVIRRVAWVVAARICAVTSVSLPSLVQHSPEFIQLCRCCIYQLCIRHANT
jgi:hypothetical protein